jgi:threonine dehydratase
MPSSRPMRNVRAPAIDDLYQARRTVAAVLPATPVSLGPFTLKLEGLQPTGSFKVRGALAALDALDPTVPVVAASAGNHGLGIAFAATHLGRTATIVTSTKASPAKIAAIRHFAVRLEQAGTSYDEAEARALELAVSGGHYLSGYNDPLVIAGQGTIGFELSEQIAGPLVVVCGVGGGGLASGLGLWASTRSDVRVVGVEVAGSRAMSAALEAGHQVPVEVADTLADGLAGNLEPGSVTIGLVARYVDELVTVTEEELRDAMRYLAGERGVVAEGAGAVPVAAVLAGRVPDGPGTVAVVSGRNIDARSLAEVLMLGVP